MSSETTQLDRNLKGREWERKGEINRAISLYEKNVAENFEGNFPYDRLAIIYRKRKQYDEEKRVLLHAIYVFENIVHHGRGDRLPKLYKFQEHLAKLEEIMNKNKI